MSTINTNALRQLFSQSICEMYQHEVPQFATLRTLVNTTNGSLSCIEHGAIRLANAAELNNIRRLLAMFGMLPVGYYDLSIADIPVHSTAFRPIAAHDISQNSLRMFCSVIRMDVIDDPALRATIKATAALRHIISTELEHWLAYFEEHGAIPQAQANNVVTLAVDTFRWNSHALIDAATYQALYDQHPLLADIVSFSQPHINHLTPATTDIDACQQAMERAFNGKVKSNIEGPPARNIPILLRQTAFLACAETATFTDGTTSQHRARFGEIEQRGSALTPKGRALYDECLHTSQQLQAAGASYVDALHQAFIRFPDDILAMFQQQLGYFHYSRCQDGDISDVPQAVADNTLAIQPIEYQDFLPVSAAGIFSSNIGNQPQRIHAADAAQQDFEQALGCAVIDPFVVYAAQQQASIDCLVQ